MELTKNEDDNYTINLTKEELCIINNALNEVCNGIDLFEFDTRIGASLEDVNVLLKNINSKL